MQLSDGQLCSISGMEMFSLPLSCLVYVHSREELQWRSSWEMRDKSNLTNLQFWPESRAMFNNYSPKWRWLAVDIYRAAERRGKYPTLATDTEVNSCFSIY